MKVLIISSEIPYPPTYGGARLKLFELLKRLSHFHELTLLTLLDAEEERAYLPQLQPYCRSVRSFLRPDPSTPPKRRDYLRAPCWRMWYSAQLAGAIREELMHSRYDLVHVEAGCMAMYVQELPRMPRLLAATDCLTALYSSQILQSPTLVERAKRTWRAHTFRVYERKLYPRYDACVVVSQPDADALARLCPRLPIWVIPNGVDTDYYVPRPDAEIENQLVFTGTMDYGPNEDAAIHLVKDILPRIRRAVPDVQLAVVGRQPTEAVQALADAGGVTVPGYVPDLRPHVHRASVYVCPIRQGAGMKNKMLEALSMGKAIVATRAAASGLAVADGRELLVRDDDVSFAAAVVGLMRAAGSRRRLGEAARAYVLAHHSWEESGRLMDAAYSETVARATSQRGGAASP